VLMPARARESATCKSLIPQMKQQANYRGMAL
jgi:hypothetical protein